MIENLPNEVWKPIVGYNNGYEVSNMGRIKSLAKRWVCNNGAVRSKEETIKIGNLDKRGYEQTSLYRNGRLKTFKIHRLVWDHFGDAPPDGRKLQIDHIDENKKNNKISNLQLKNKTSSRYTGVCFHKLAKKWMAYIYINRKSIYLGLYNCETAAMIAYQQKSNVLTCN